MLSTVQFNHAFLFDTSKIRNIRADWMLTPKAITMKLPSSYCTPQYAFNIGHITA